MVEGPVGDLPAEESPAGAGGDREPGEVALDLSEEGGEVVNEIDLTAADEVVGDGEWGDHVVTQSYELAVKREDMRGKLAFGLLLLLAVVVLLSFGTVWIRQDLTPEIKDLLTLIFGPVVTLVGAATGYYFGGRGQGPQQG